MTRLLHFTDRDDAMHAAMAFLQRETDYGPTYPGMCIILFDRDTPICVLKRGYRTSYKRHPNGYWEGGAEVDPVIMLLLHKDWRKLVYDRGLSYLPASPIAKPVLILHAEEGWSRNCVQVAPAYWTPGGQVVKRGFLAWRVDYWDRNQVLAWSVGSTEQRAVNKLQRWPAAVEMALVSRDDADAMEGLFS